MCKNMYERRPRYLLLATAAADVTSLLLLTKHSHAQYLDFHCGVACVQDCKRPSQSSCWRDTVSKVRCGSQGNTGIVISMHTFGQVRHWLLCESHLMMIKHIVSRHTISRRDKVLICNAATRSEGTIMHIRIWGWMFKGALISTVSTVPFRYHPG